MIIASSPVRFITGGAAGQDRQTRSASGKAELPARALVAIAPLAATAGERRPHRHAESTLVTQLFAIRDNLPQTRDRRRAEPAEAIAFYQAGAKAVAPHIRPARDISA